MRFASECLKNELFPYTCSLCPQLCCDGNLLISSWWLWIRLRAILCIPVGIRGNRCIPLRLTL